jgi:hypothetical protein
MHVEFALNTAAAAALRSETGTAHDGMQAHCSMLRPDKVTRRQQAPCRAGLGWVSIFPYSYMLAHCMHPPDTTDHLNGHCSVAAISAPTRSSAVTCIIPIYSRCLVVVADACAVACAACPLAAARSALFRSAHNCCCCSSISRAAWRAFCFSTCMQQPCICMLLVCPDLPSHSTCYSCSGSSP